MFRPRIDYVLLFHLGSGRHVITNLFVFQTIDLIFLDADKCVLSVRRRFRPFTPFHFPPRGTAYLIETPPNAAPDLQEGEQLAFRRA